MLERVNRNYTLNRNSLAHKIAAKVPNSIQNVQQILRLEEKEIKATVAKQGAVQLQNFGTFRRNLHHAYVAHKPRTNEPIKIQAKQVPYFDASNSFKKQTNN